MGAAVVTGAEAAKRLEYVPDFTSRRNDDLCVYAEGFFKQDYAYANGQRISQTTSAWADTAGLPGTGLPGTGGPWIDAADTAGMGMPKANVYMPMIPEELYIHEDIMGSARRFTGADGSTFAEIEYDVWGLPVIRGGGAYGGGNGGGLDELAGFTEYGEALNPRYTNHTYDATLGMYHAQHRFFDAENRGFTQVDPVKDTLNWYGYCGGNPASYVDPLGLASDDMLNYGSGLESAMIEAWMNNKTMSIEEYKEYFPSSMCPPDKKALAQKGYMLLDRFSELTQQQIDLLKKMSPASRQFWLEGIDEYGGKSRLEAFTSPYDYTKVSPYPSYNFGDKRPYSGNPERSHAAIDIYPQKGQAMVGVPIYAVTEGTVISTGGFYSGTDQVTIRNIDGSIVRYGELSSGVKVGDTVKQGDEVGKTKKMVNDTELHIEFYTGELGYDVTKSNPLTQQKNNFNPYVDDQRYKSNGKTYEFERRADLVDPSLIGTIISPPEN